MKKYVFLTLALVVAASTLATAAVHIVGGGTPNTNNTYPFTAASAFRWQTMWFQTELGETGPVSKIEWQVYSGARPSPGGTFNNCDILLCHTSVKAVTSTFATNYGGKTPVNVFKGTYVLPASVAEQWMTIVEPTNFTFNNTDNLLIEISWQGGSASSTFFKVRMVGSPLYPGRVYNSSSKTETTGSITTNYHQYGRITIGAIPGVAPTSLGRVKSIFR